MEQWEAFWVRVVVYQLFGGLVGGTVGDYVKEYAKTGIPTDKEIEVRKTYSEVRRK